MEDGNEIRRELEDWQSPLSGYSRKTPFEADESYLKDLPGQLYMHAHGGLTGHQAASKKMRFHIPLWTRGLAAGLLLFVSGYAGYEWMSVVSPERKVVRELRREDAGSIEKYLTEHGIDPAELLNTSQPENVQTAQELAGLNSAEIREYLNQFPPTEISSN